MSEEWDKEDWKTNPKEEQILSKLNLSFEMVYMKKEMRIGMPEANSDKFTYPTENFIKLNFDSAAKGNPGTAGFGGIFQDNQERTRWIYAEGGGDMTNNEAELWALHQGLGIAIRNGYSNLEITGDSQLVIEILKNLNNGKSWEQVTKSWRTAAVVRDITGLLERLDYKIFLHVRRKGNKPADYLANWGCKCQNARVDSQWEAIKKNHEWKELNDIIHEDHKQASRSTTPNT